MNSTFAAILAALMLTLPLLATDQGATVRRFTGLPSGDGTEKVTGSASYPYSPASVIELNSAEFQNFLPDADGALIETAFIAPAAGAYRSGKRTSPTRPPPAA